MYFHSLVPQQEPFIDIDTGSKFSLIQILILAGLSGDKFVPIDRVFVWGTFQQNESMQTKGRY